MKTLLYIAILAPLTALAAPPTDLIGLGDRIAGLADDAIAIIIGIAVVAFLWGVSRVVLYAGDADAKKSGKEIMIYGLIAIFIMVSVWGIINMLRLTVFGY